MVVKFFNDRVAVIFILGTVLTFNSSVLFGSDNPVVEKEEGKHIRRLPMPLNEAVTIIKEAHLKMKNSGKYYLALAIDPGDAETRQPTRFWIFDYSPITGHRWVTYPRSLPGIYTKLTSMTVNGNFPEEYLTENGDLISMRVSSDVIEHPSKPILISYGSTTAELELRDDSGRNVKIVLSPQVKKNKGFFHKIKEFLRWGQN